MEEKKNKDMELSALNELSEKPFIVEVKRRGWLCFLPAKKLYIRPLTLSTMYRISSEIVSMADADTVFDEIKKNSHSLSRCLALAVLGGGALDARVAVLARFIRHNMTFAELSNAWSTVQSRMGLEDFAVTIVSIRKLRMTAPKSSETIEYINEE
ncbi:MAG: hypothetical protein PHD21_07390 [Flavobacteriales bacterium]|nr:hypothetical protein [Flavobacteriales bacterium]